MMQDQDSELLFGQDVYNNLIRDDSLLTRTGSNNFAALMEFNDPAIPPNPSPEQQQQQQHSTQQQQQQQCVFAQDSNGQGCSVNVVPREYDFINVPQQQHDVPQQQPDHADALAWRMMAERVTNSSAPLLLQQSDFQQEVAKVEEGPSTLVADSSTSLLAPAYPPSLQPWPGRHIFSITLPTDNKDRNKWCYSQMQQKLYVCPNVAVPVKVLLGNWTTDASIFITPVYKDSRFRVDPVRRCYNCKSGQVLSESSQMEHLVQVEGDGNDYLLMNDRHVVSSPLHPPPPGEVSTTLLVKLMCLTSCVGGPNRRPFCLVFTLRNNTGVEIGRQVLDVKCCKCPSRDMNHEEKSFTDQEVRGALEQEQFTRVQKLASTIAVGRKRKRTNIKLEPGNATKYENVPIPVEFVSKVKMYVNALAGEKYLQQNQPGFLPFSDQE